MESPWDRVTSQKVQPSHGTRFIRPKEFVSDVSGKAIANLATEELSHPNPLFHGDTLFVESEVLEVKPSRSKPDRGTVRVHTRAYNQDGLLVAEFKRVVLVPRKEPGAAAADGGGGDRSGQGNVD